MLVVEKNSKTLLTQDFEDQYGMDLENQPRKQSLSSGNKEKKQNLYDNLQNK